MGCSSPTSTSEVMQMCKTSTNKLLFRENPQRDVGIEVILGDRLKRMQRCFVVHCGPREEEWPRDAGGTVLLGGAVSCPASFRGLFVFQPLGATPAPCSLDDGNTVALAIGLNTEGPIIKNIFLLESSTKMKCLAPVGLRRSGKFKTS